MANTAFEVVRMRHDFYRGNYRKALGGLLLALVFMGMLTSMLIYQLRHPPAPVYFAVTEDGRVLPVDELNQPNLTNPEILHWAHTAAIAAYTYNFVNWRQELQAASEFFTPNGWRAFLKALTDSNNLTAVQAKKLIVSAESTGEPVLVKQGLHKGIYTWVIRIPVLVTYQNSLQFAQQAVTITMTITRIPSLNSALGIGIAQFVVA